MTAPGATTSYPAHREVDVALRDGSTARVRPVRAQDRDGLRDFLAALSTDSRAFRFFGGGTNLEWAADWAVDVDYVNRYGLVVTTGADERIIGHAAYMRTDNRTAEVAFEVADELQGQGIGTILLAHLAQAAQDADIPVFTAVVLPSNHKMIDVFRQSGFPVEVRALPDALHITAPTSATPDAVARFDERDSVAATAALRHVLEPDSVAVIGASRKRGSVGGELFHNLLQAGFHGPVYPINRQARVVQSVPAYKSLADVPEPVDLAVIAVPAADVLDAARECAEKGVHALVVISAGFAEANDEGRAAQRELLRICRASGMRLVGPNCLGVLNTAPGIRLNATFGPTFPPSGGVGFMSQSGALGLAVVAEAEQLGLGLSSFVSVGNKADVSGNDVLSYWESDDATSVILLYLESFGNPRRFARIARRIGTKKPIVAVKSGRSIAGAKAAASHTGALLASSDANTEALFHQSGVIRTDTLGELFDVASLLSGQPLPRGSRVAVLTNSGGPGIMCADACEAEGLKLAALAEDTTETLRALLPAEASLANPVDMIATASTEHYSQALKAVAADPGVDAAIVIYTPVMGSSAGEVAAAIADVSQNSPVPVLAVLVTATAAQAPLSAVGVPSYEFPEEAVRALARAVRYSEWRSRSEEPPDPPDGCQPGRAAAVIASALSSGRSRWLEPDEVATLLEAYGIRMAEWRIVNSPAAAAHAAREMGGQVAVKAISPTLVHKTEAGAVELGLKGGRPVERAARDMRARVREQGHEVEGFLVQRMLEGGVEMLLGVVNDPVFGPVVACGAGGTAAELLKDVSVRLTPVSQRDARDMLRALKSFPLLDGYRGAPKTDLDSLEDMVIRVAALVEAHPEIAEMDLNPVMATPDGAAAADARIRVDLAAPRRPWPSV
ncbi:MAG TPA: GNAT family N-acetyltransferase [Thermoleophilaceae bacterium]